jgi:signal transduction histidine kinase
MFKRLVDGLNSLLTRLAKKNKLIQVTIFLAIVLPIILIGASGYHQTYQDLTELTLSRRQSIAALAATVLKQRFERLTDIGVSLATRVRFRQLLNEGKWDEAIQILNSVREDFPFIDRVFLADPDGTLMTDSPALPGVRGKNFSTRDWYQGVRKNWKPYVSDAYTRAAAPQYNVIAAAIPVREKEKIIGILVLQVQINDLLEWSNLIELDSSAFIYFVDRKGQLATHPKISSVGDLVDYSGLSIVKKALGGQTGVETILNSIENEERIASYAPVPGIGWGVIVQEPVTTAFARRDENLQRLLLRYGLILLIGCGLAVLILRAFMGIKRAEQKIQALNQDLEQRAIELQATNKELEAFSYSVSHDLRAPLRAIDGFSQALLEDYGEKFDALGKDYLGRVREASQQMAQLIDDMLNLGRVTRTAITRGPVDLGELADSIVSELQKAEPERRVDFCRTDKLMVNGDERLLRVTLDNLLGNAWKFTGKCPEPKVEFGTVQNNGSAAYFIRDNGAGFDMAYMDKLFGPFQRLHAMTEFKGTGVGLATVQRIVHRHGGRVWAEAQVGKGATFYFTLS